MFDKIRFLILFPCEIIFLVMAFNCWQNGNTHNLVAFGLVSLFLSGINDRLVEKLNKKN